MRYYNYSDGYPAVADEGSRQWEHGDDVSIWWLSRLMRYDMISAWLPFGLFRTTVHHLDLRIISRPKKSGLDIRRLEI